MNKSSLFAFSLLIICARAALQFKKPADSAYTGENYLDQDAIPLDGNKNEGDNAICYSESMIGLVDGESEQVGEYTFPAKYLSTMVANSVFGGNSALFTGVKQVDEKMDQVKARLLNAVKTSTIAASKQYHDKINEAAKMIYYTMAADIPQWDSILEPFKQQITEAIAAHKTLYDGYAKFNPSADNSKGSLVAQSTNPNKGQAVAIDLNSPEFLLDRRSVDIQASSEKINSIFNANLKALTSADQEYTRKILDFKRKINTGLAIVALRITNNVESANIFTKAYNGITSSYAAKQATVHGYQYGRSFVGVFGRVSYDKTTGANKEVSYKNVYRLKSYHQTKFRDLYRSFPEASPVDSRVASRDPNMNKLTEFSFTATEGQIVMVADSTLIDNFSYSFLGFLLNLGLHKLYSNDKWDPETDTDLLAALSEYINKMGSPNTLKRAFYLLTSNPAFEKVEEFKAASGVASCSLDAFYPAIGGFWYRSKNKVMNAGENTCLLKISKQKHFFVTPTNSEDTSTDPLIPKFNPKIISKMFAFALKKVQTAMKEKVGGAEIPSSFLTYKQVISWRNQIVLANEKKPLGDAAAATRITKMIEAKSFTPVAGDLTIFVNILVKDAPEANSLVCTKISDEQGKAIPSLLKTFFEKTTNLEILEQDPEEEVTEEQRDAIQKDQLNEEQDFVNQNERLI